MRKFVFVLFSFAVVVSFACCRSQNQAAEDAIKKAHAVADDAKRHASKLNDEVTAMVNKAAKDSDDAMDQAEDELHIAKRGLPTPPPDGE